MLINPCPKVAFSSLNLKPNTLVWFAQLSLVLAKSPFAIFNLSNTNLYLKATFSCSDILDVVFP